MFLYHHKIFGVNKNYQKVSQFENFFKFHDFVFEVSIPSLNKLIKYQI